MKIVFKDSTYTRGPIQVSLDGGSSWTGYRIEDVRETGITLRSDQDLSLIKIKGRIVAIKNISIVSSTKRIKFTIDTNKHGPTFPDCVVGIEFQDGTTYIGGNSLSNYVNLANIFIPNSVTFINKSSFYNCSSLTNINIPNSVTSIPEKAFYGCRSLTNINIPDGTSIGKLAFAYCSSLTNIPDNIDSLPEGVFRGCSSLTNIVIPNGVNIIGVEAFYYCTKLTSISIPNSVTLIEESAFCECSSLTNIVIPNSVTLIEESAFSDCINLKSIVIPTSVTEIENYVFYNCSNLTTIYYAGTKEQWDTITKPYWNKNMPSNTQIVYNYKVQ